MPIQATTPQRGKQTTARTWQDTLTQLEDGYRNKAIANYEAACWVEMACMAEMTHGGTLKITGEYPSALKPTLQKLQSIQKNKTELEKTRAGILEKLPAAFGRYEMAYNFLNWDGMGELVELPEYETQPLNAIAKHIHLYPDNEHGHHMDRFMCLCLALWYVNYHLEIPITSLELIAHEVALFDAPPVKQKFRSDP
jgi:hypothetical protein